MKMNSLQKDTKTIMAKDAAKNRRWYPVVIVFFAFVLLFGGAFGCSCTNQSNQETEPETETQTVKPTEPETETQTEAETETEVVDTGFRNPLTGEMTETDLSKQRPYFVMLNTSAAAMPQRGNSKADILIEMMEEGGVTRVMGLYQSLEGVGQLGPIRSTREYFYSWSLAFDGLLVHAGGDAPVRAEIKNAGMKTLDALENAGGAYFRDKERQQHVANEHTMFTTGENLLAMTNHLNFEKQITKADQTQLHFVDDATPADGDNAENVKVIFSGAKSTTFTYNEESKLYSIKFWDMDYVDEDNGNAIVEVRNILILPVPNWTKQEGTYIRQKYDLTSGEGVLITGGKSTKMKWTKGDYLSEGHYADPLCMYDMDGNDLNLSVGKTYICVIGNGMVYTIE